MEYKKIGKKLKEIRTRKGLTYEQIYEITRIQPNVLQDIENGKSLISPVFLKGFIKTYALILGLNLNELVTQFKEEMSEPKKKKREYNKSKLKLKKQLKEKSTRFFKKYISSFFKKTSLFIFLFFILAFVGIKTFKPLSVRGNKNLININKEDSIKGKEIQIGQDFSESKKVDDTDQILFSAIKLSEYTKDLFIQVYAPVKIYFKVDRQNMITKNLEAFSIFNIKAKQRIYLRFDKNLKDSNLFYNGNQVVVLDSNSFFEKIFTE